MSTEKTDVEEGPSIAEVRASSNLDQQDVTMRGDLEQISLSDIFQTLSMSKMEGVLRVRNPLEQHDLYFKDGYVRCLVKNRQESRRLGQRLMQCGLIDRDMLRHALARQKESGQPLGSVLVNQRAISQEQIDEVVGYYQAEDIYSLFLWRQGDFEFYKGAVVDQQLHERFEILPDHDCGAILLEVARRSDEWNVILDEVSSVDEILAPRVDADVSQLSGDALVVFSALDGRRSIRELAEFTQLALFDAARAARDLAAWGMVEIAPAQLMVEAAAAQIERNEEKRAVVTLRTLLGRGFDLGDTLLREVAELLEQGGESRMAGQCLRQRAQSTDDPDERLSLAREAARLDSRSSNVFEFLRKTLLAREDADPVELMEISHQLADAFETERKEESAIEVLSQLEDTAAEHPGTTSRLARLYTRAGQSEHAVEQLLLLADHYQAERKRERLIAVYEQVLKLDPSRKEVQKALKSARVSAETRRKRRMLLAVAVVVSIGAATLLYQFNLASSQRAEKLAKVQAAIDSGDLASAAKMLAVAADELGDTEAVAALGATIDRARKQAAESTRQERERGQQKQLGAAANSLQKGDLTAALTVYEELWKQRASNPLIEKAIRNRLGGVRPRLDERLRDLPHFLPERPSSAQTESQRKEAIATLRREFIESDLKLAQSVPMLLEHELGGIIFKELDRKKLGAAASKTRELYAQAAELLSLYVTAQQRVSIELSLQPLFERARKEESAHDFVAALASYRELAERYPVDNDLRKHFHSQSERLGKIVESIAQLDAHTTNGDFEKARDTLRFLTRSEPSIPFENMLELPLRVVTMPIGATVKVDGETIGKTPVIARYVPARKTAIDVELDGFEPVARSIHGDAVGSMSLALAKSSAWTFECSGSVSRHTSFDAASDTLLIADRSGRLCALEGDSGDFRWEYESGDLSGLLQTPWVDGDTVLVTSIDGPLRGLGKADGSLQWTVPNLESEAPPIVWKRRIAVLTTNSECVLLHSDTRQIIERIALPGRVSSTPLLVGRRIVAATSNGHLIAIDASAAKLDWSIELGERCVASPAAIDKLVFAATDEGEVVGVDASKGKELWRRKIGSEVTLDLTTAGQRVLVASLETVYTFESDGREGPGFVADAILAVPPTVVEDTLFLGTRANRIVALNSDDLELRYQIRGTTPPSAPAGRMNRRGDVVVTFGRELRGIRTIR